VSRETRRLELEDSVLRLGFVDAATLGALIKHSVALVMPTYLGPTNLPPLQAVMVGTPAIVSDCHHFSPDIQRHLTVLSLESGSDWALAMRDMLHSRPNLPRIEVDLGMASREIERVLERFLSRQSSWTSFSY
jgi:glycosyltransferase involved in cell wall biosynthesis